VKTHALTRVVLLPAALTTLALSTGCVSGPRVTEPMRAIWVTRFDYETAEDVNRIVDDCADAGFNAILFQVRGNGTAFYESQIEPWAVELGGKHPGFDPLKLACDRAHDRGVELHAYVNVMPAWRGKKPPANPDQLYNKRPEWFWYDQHGNRQKLSSFYVSLNPCLTEVREYIVGVFEEIVAGYDIDGLHLDYIRFPNEHPATPKGSGLDYPRDERTLALYKQATGLTPDEDKAAWNQWRTDQVSQLVADIHDMIAETKPSVVLSAAIGSVRRRALHHFQDGRQWMKDGSIDAVLLMNYTDDPVQFANRIDPWLDPPPTASIVPGLWFGKHKGRTTEEAMVLVQMQIATARVKTDNFCIFAYSSLFDGVDKELTSQSGQARSKRQIRRDVLLPYLQKMAETDK
jgi:uncharacterized lipoprotein YddW (UPF0748 family)